VPENKAPSRLEAALLGASLTAAAAAFASAQRSPLFWLGLAPAALAGLLRVEVLPRRRRGLVDYGVWAAISVVAILALLWTIYPVVPEAFVTRGTQAAASAALLLAAASLASRAASHAPARNIIPAIGALLVAALLNPPLPSRPIPPMIVAALALGAYLAVDGRPRLRLPLLPIAFLLLAGLLGFGITSFLPWLQPFVEGATVRMITPKGTSSFAGMSSSSRLGDIEEIALSEQVVMRVATDVPQRLRARVFARFDGITWQSQPASRSFDLVPQAALDPGLARWLQAIPGEPLAGAAFSAQDAAQPGVVRTKIVQIVFNGGALVAPAGPLLVSLPGPVARLDAFGILSTGSSLPVEIYAVLNLPGVTPPAPGEVEASFLAVPANTDERLRSLAARLSDGAPEPRERVRRTLLHLERECRYSLKVGRFSSRQPVAEFLFEKKRGYCEYFASAAALLLRLQGVPARYVTGFNVRDDNYEAGSYVVREADAHAWIEALLPEEGWVELDPTPSAQYDAVHRRRTAWLASAMEWLKAAFAEATARLHGGDWRANARYLAQHAALPGLALLLVVGVMLLRRFFPSRPKRATAAAGTTSDESAAVPEELRDLLSRFEASLRRRGRGRAPNRAPLEHLESLPHGALPPPLLDLGERVVRRYYAVRFGGEASPPGEISRLRVELERLDR
jgi:transglutaminase-like putative cysteine protease